MLDPKLVRWFDSLTPIQQGEFMAEVLASEKSVIPDDPIEWITKNFHIPELKGPITLYPYQIATLREAHKKDDRGKFIYNVVVWSDIKKSAKSTIAAAVALYRAHQVEWGSIKIIANDLKQADSRVAYYLRRAITLNGDMAGIKQRNYKTTLPNDTIIEAIPIDPAGEAGGNDDLIIFSELWAAKHKAIVQMWTEMTLSPQKFGYSQRWVETYAGYGNESPILEQLYETGVMHGKRLDLSYEGHDLSDLEVYANEDLLCLWNDRPRLPWQTSEYYASEEKVLVPSEFNRIHRNQWATSTEKFVEIIWWDACKEQLPELTRSEPVVIALDAATGGTTTQADCFAMVMVSRHPGADRKQDVAVRYCGIWNPPPGGYLDFEPIEEELIRLCKTYAVVEVAFDRSQLHDMTMRLQKKEIALFKEFSQQKPRLLADKQLRDLIMARRISHDGNPLLREHIDNSYVKKKEDTIRIEKRVPSLKVDGSVSLAMAANRILYFNL